MPDSLTVAIIPENGGVTFDALHRAVEALRRLIADVDASVTQRPTRRRARKWYVEHIHASSPTITLRPAVDGDDSGERSVEAIVSGIQWINAAHQDAPPPYFSERELEDLLDIRRLQSQGITRFEFSSDREITDSTAEQRHVLGVTDVPAHIIPGRIAEQVSRILRSGDEEYGALEGVLDAINLHRAPTFTFWESITGLAVRCTFTREYEDNVRGLLRHRVRVSGLVHYFADGRPRRVTEFESIEDMAPITSGPRASFGSIPDFTGGRGSVEYLRVLRAE